MNTKRYADSHMPRNAAPGKSRMQEKLLDRNLQSATCNVQYRNVCVNVNHWIFNFYSFIFIAVKTCALAFSPNLRENICLNLSFLSLLASLGDGIVPTAECYLMADGAR